MYTTKNERQTIGWPMNLIKEIFNQTTGKIRCRLNNDDFDIDIETTSINDIEQRIMCALSQTATWERDIVLMLFRDDINITDIAIHFNISQDRVNYEAKSVCKRIGRLRTRCHDAFFYGDPEYTIKHEKIEKPIELKVKVITLNTDICDIGLSSRACNALMFRAHNIKELIAYNKKELATFKGIGSVTLNEIVNLIEGYGFEFAENK